MSDEDAKTRRWLERRLEVYRTHLNQARQQQAIIDARVGGMTAQEMTVEIPRDEFESLLKLAVEALESRLSDAT